MPVETAEASFDFFGLRLAVEGWPEVVEAVGLDFAWFAGPRATRPEVRVVVNHGTPRLDRFGEVAASFVTTRNAVYQLAGRTIVDYFGRALVIVDPEGGEVTVEGDEPALVHEAVYLYVLSRAGQHLDENGYLRLHSLALSGPRGAVALLLPAGGGKSTLALRALQEDGVRLISDDTPVLDRNARVHAFPLRLGVSAAVAADLPSEQVRVVERLEFPSKHVLSLSSFSDRIEASPQPLRHIVIGQRSLGREARLERVPRRQAAIPLARDGVVGLGVAQMAEYVLHQGWSDVLGKAGTAVGRARICALALARAQTWKLRLGRDQERNWAAISSLVQ